MLERTSGQDEVAEKARIDAPDYLPRERKVLIDPTPIPLIQDIQEQFLRRRVFEKNEQRSINSVNAELARRAGYKLNMSQAERKAFFDEANKLRLKIEAQMKPAKKFAGRAGQIADAEEATSSSPARKNPRKGRNGDGHARRAAEARSIAPSPLHDLEDILLVQSMAQLRAPIVEARRALEAKMEELAKGLPVYDWWISIHGLSALGLAMIFGEEGNLWRYKSKSQFWKRMGVAVIDGECQKRVRGKRTEDSQGYNPERRATLWKITFSLLMAQKTPNGPYYQTYQRRRAATEEREDWTPRHKDNDARRYVAKQLLGRLLAEWKSFA
jgi:hypothetical protein